MKERKKTKRIEIRLSEEELLAIDQLAKKMNVKRSVVFLTGIKLLSEDARVKEATNIDHYEAKGENVDV